MMLPMIPEIAIMLRMIIHIIFVPKAIPPAPPPPAVDKLLCMKNGSTQKIPFKIFSETVG